MPAGIGVSSPRIGRDGLGIASVGSPTVILPADSPGNANPGQSLQAPGGGRYQYNLKTFEDARRWASTSSTFTN